MKIVNIRGREVLDSRGYPTVEVEMLLENGRIYRAMVPSGASTGSREGLELRDNDMNRFLGKGVLRAVSNVNDVINNALVGKDVEEVDDILLRLDSSGDKHQLGVNAILPISICAFKYEMENKPLKDKREPRIMCNVINGGVHADNDLDVQEFMIIPNASSLKENIRMAAEIFHHLKELLKENGYSTSVGDEGGFSPELKLTDEVLDVLKEATEKSGYTYGKDVFIGLDIAATQIFDDSVYSLDGTRYKVDDYVNRLVELSEEYPILSLEDPFEENDFESHAKLTEKLGNDVMIVGDDLFTTNTKFLRQGLEKGSCNAILIKPNQIGTIKEVMEVVSLAKANGYKVIFSHRSGDTEDPFIADLAVYLGADYVKFGSMSRSERTSKYNELLRIFDK